MSQNGYCNDSRCEKTRKGEPHLAHSLQVQDQKTVDKLKELLSLGSDLTGGISGAATGLLVAGPVGALVGGAAGTVIGHILQTLGEDYAVRFLSPNEKKRVGGVIGFAAEKVEKNRKKGMKPREDDFLKEETDERSSAEEILEGILLAAQREYEEKKIRYYGNLLANLGFIPISKSQANLCLRISQGLTYRQLCLLAIFGQHDRFRLREINYREHNTMDPEVATILHEISELERLNLITQGNAVLGITDINPGKMRLEGRGVTLFHLMELSEMSERELAEPAALLG